MANPQTAPFGTWKSPITPEMIVGETIRLGSFALDGDNLYWSEGRPAEGGRNVIVCRTPDGTTHDITEAGFNVRTLVHEYGGGAFLVADGVLYSTNFADQRLYRQRVGVDEHAQPITPDNTLRYADMVLDTPRNRIICICEDHRQPAGTEAENLLVSVPLDGVGLALPLARGNSFYASPRLSPDGTQLAWLTWNHPNMPWNGTELWVGTLGADGAITSATLVAGGKEESVFQPEWSPNGVLHFVSDRSGWWNLYRQRDGQIEPLHPMEAEFGEPQWVFGLSLYAFAAEDRIICTYTQHGQWHLASLDITSGTFTEIATPYTFIARVQARGEQVWLTAGSPTEHVAIVQLDLASGTLQTLRRVSNAPINPAYIAIAEPVEFPTTQNRTAYGFYYPPKNQDFIAPTDEKPPLLVKSHGGPVSATTDTLRFDIQYWTSRGFAVLDVNYGGSTGYGRAYRKRLERQWGIVDVEDCINGARSLAARGLVDVNRLMITGGSAGGYTTLCALTFHDVFKAGASHFGISDIKALMEDSHKFEAHDMENLIGPYPERADLYRERSPIHFAEQLSCPVIFFQGLEDKVVPPNQSELMVSALRAKGVPVAYVTFAGEQHGFRKAANIKRALEGEFFFYARVFGYTPADAIEPIVIDNL